MHFTYLQKIGDIEEEHLQAITKRTFLQTIAKQTMS